MGYFRAEYRFCRKRAYKEIISSRHKKSDIIKQELQVQIHELRVQTHELRV